MLYKKINKKISQALAHIKEDNMELAEISFKEVLKLSPHNLEALENLTYINTQRGDTEKAQEYLAKALTYKPTAKLYCSMANLLNDSGKKANAIEHYKKALELDPNNVLANTNLASIYLEENMIDDSFLHASNAVNHHPDSPEALYCLANVMLTKQDFEESIKYAQESLNYKEDFAEVYNLMGLAYNNKEEYDTAITHYKKAIEINPFYKDAYFNMGKCYVVKEDLVELENCLIKVLELDPNSSDAYKDLGDLYYDKAMPEKAIKYYEKSIELNPENTEILLDLACAYLCTKDFSHGWKYYEKRNSSEHNFIKELTDKDIPKWEGSPLENKAIYVFHEQGVSDTIQFCRYLPTLNSMGANVIFKAQEELKELLNQSDLKAQIIDENEFNNIPEFDYFTSLLSLPAVFNINEHNLSGNLGYLKSDKYKVNYYKDKFFNNDDFKIGICWQGNTNYTYDNKKSIPPKYFCLLTQIPNAKLYSLQYDFLNEQLETIPDNFNIVDLGKTFSNFSDTAAAIENLDIVITSDNAIAHLAGALGKKTYLLLSYKAHWCWFNDCDTTCWYDSVKLFRKNAYDTWDDVFDRVIDTFIDRETEKQYNLALDYFEKNELQKTENICKNLIASKKEEPKIDKLLGLTYFKRDKFKECIKILTRASENSLDEDIFYTLGIAYIQIQEPVLAISNLKRTIELNPGHFKSLFKLIPYLNEKGYKEEAIKYGINSVTVYPESHELCYNLSCAFLNNNDDLAIEYANKALNFKKDFLEAFNTIGLAYTNKNYFEQAINNFNKAIEINQSFDPAHYNIGIAYSKSGNNDMAIRSYEKAIEINPNYAHAYNNLGTEYFEKYEYQKAISCYNKAITIQPDLHDAHVNLSIIYLMFKDFKKGLNHYEHRTYLDNYGTYDLLDSDIPKWNGLPLINKTVYVYHDQGIGDTIQFLRYLPLVKGTDTKILFKPQKELYSLIKENNFDVDLVDESTKAESVKCNFYCPIASLPYIFRTELDNIPSSDKYINADNSRVNYYKDNHFNNDKLKIGICWQGNQNYKNDKKRSVQLNYFYRFANMQNIQLYSLQKGYGEEQLENLPEDINIIDLGKTFNDFSDTAAALENIDILITTDTAIVHLAGAMGKKTYLLLSYKPDWRWFLDAETTPWYQSVVLVRQKEPDNWEYAFNKVYDYINKPDVLSKYDLADQYYSRNDLENSAKIYMEILKESPNHIKALKFMSFWHYNNKNYTDSLYYLTRLISFKPTKEAYLYLGQSLNALNKQEEAIKYYKYALKLDTDNEKIIICLVNSLIKASRLDEALEYANRALALNPGSLDAYHCLSTIYINKKEYNAAIEYANQNIKLDHNSFYARINLGLAYVGLEEYAKGIEYYYSALDIYRDCGELYYNLGVAYFLKVDLDKAIEFYNKAINYFPDNPDLNTNLGISYLTLSDLDKGFKHYEYRLYCDHEHNKYELLNSSIPKWDGYEIKGKTIYIHHEQGIGDTINFIRYLPLLSDLGAKVICKVQNELKSLLLENNFNAEIIDNNTHINKLNIDVYSPLLSLPYLFKANKYNIPLTKQYIKANNKHIQFYKQNYFNNDKFKIGICWQGNPLNKDYKYRSIPLSSFYRLTELDKVQVYSLIKTNNEEMVQSTSNIVNLGFTFRDFYDTAAAIENLDLVITSDTAIAHLAGAMGKKTFLLLSERPDWRWFLDCDTTIWYDSVKVFRKQPNDHWETVFKNVIEHIKQGRECLV